MQPGRSAPKERDNVTATRDCSRVTAILYSWLATRLRSLAIILPIHLFTITRVHVCNRIPIISIRMPIRPSAGVRALTPPYRTTPLQPTASRSAGHERNNTNLVQGAGCFEQMDHAQTMAKWEPQPGVNTELNRGLGAAFWVLDVWRFSTPNSS